MEEESERERVRREEGSGREIFKRRRQKEQGLEENMRT